jgi:hypothetical protein
MEIELGKMALRSNQELLSFDEKEAFRLLGDFQRKVAEEWKLKRGNNLEMELASAIHVLQGFVIQHMLQRQAPQEFGEWYNDK